MVAYSVSINQTVWNVSKANICTKSNAYHVSKDVKSALASKSANSVMWATDSINLVTSVSHAQTRIVLSVIKWLLSVCSVRMDFTCKASIVSSVLQCASSANQRHSVPSAPTLNHTWSLAHADAMSVIIGSNRLTLVSVLKIILYRKKASANHVNNWLLTV